MGSVVIKRNGILNVYNKTTAPTSTDDNADGYNVGSRWVDTTNDAHYVCVDSSVGAAIWIRSNPEKVLSLPAIAWLKTQSDPATKPKRTQTSTNKVNYWYVGFKDGNKERKATALRSLPSDWDLGTVEVQFVWTATAGTGTVVWGIRALALGNDDALDTAYGTQVTVSDALISTGDVHVTSAVTLTIGGTPASEDQIIWEVQRLTQDASDNFSDQAKLIEVRVVYSTSIS
jgi:hypothetical protein